METVWIGDQEVAAEELTRKVVNDVQWLKKLVQAIQAELESKQELVDWLAKDSAISAEVRCAGAHNSGSPVSWVKRMNSLH